MPARFIALVIVLRTWGSTYSVVLALRDLVLEAQARRVVAPALDARDLRELLAHALGVLLRVLARGQEDA